MPPIRDAEELEDKNLVGHYRPERFSQYELLEQCGQQAVGGVCFLLCLHWIVHHKTVRSAFGKKKPTAVRIQFLQDRQRFLTLCRGQSDFLQEHGQKSGEKATELEIAEAKKYGVTLTWAGMEFTGGNYRGMGFADRADAFEKHRFMTSLLKPHTYHLIHLDGTRDGRRCNHTICWYSSGNWFADNHLYVFDPNIGEFRTGATKAEAGGFLAKLIQEYAGQETPVEIGNVDVYKATVDTSGATRHI